MQQINKVDNPKDITTLLKSLDDKLQAARDINNQNISSYTFPEIMETLGIIAYNVISGDYKVATTEAGYIVDIAKEELKRPDITMEQRILAGALINELYSIFPILNKLVKTNK